MRHHRSPWRCRSRVCVFFFHVVQIRNCCDSGGHGRCHGSSDLCSSSAGARGGAKGELERLGCLRGSACCGGRGGWRKPCADEDEDGYVRENHENVRMSSKICIKKPLPCAVYIL